MAGAKGKKKGGKSTKLSKAEKERLKKEEAERKAQEEEDAKLRAEQEAKEREEREKQEQEERRKLEEKERAQHQAEIDELNMKIEENKENLANLHKTNNLDHKWNRYMLCDGRPDPTSKKELNTYINLWKEETEFKPFQQVLQECELTLELISELEKYTEDDQLTDEDRCSYKESICDMHLLLDSKVNEATTWLLKCPENNINQETLNLQCVMKSKNFTTCIWGNTAKNPRVKNVDFPSEGFTIEIPRSLVLADVAVRLLHKYFDNLSPRCSTYLPKIKKVSDSEQPTIEKQTEQENTEKIEELTESNEKAQDSITSHLEPNREKVASRKSSRKSQRASSSSMAKEAVVEKSEEDIQKDVENEDVENELKVFDDDEDLLDEHVVDLRSFAAMQPIIYIELLELPPQQQQLNSWIMQQLVAPELKRLNYTPQMNLGKSLTESQFIEQDNHPPGSAKSNSSVPSTPNVGSVKPISIKLKVPEKVIFFEEPQMARWDETSCHWKLDGFTDVEYDEENRTISFKTTDFGPLAIMQDLYLNMPFQSWEIRPLSLNNCLFTVIAATVDVAIEIKGSRCCLRKPDERTEVSHLLGEWMSPKKMVKCIKKAGINIFPTVDGEKYVSICKKDPFLINCLYEQIALSSSAYAYSWSKWNNDCGEDTVIVGATEWNKMESPVEDDYSLYMASTRICYKLAMSEYDENVSKDIAENTQMHPDLFHMVQDGCGDNVKQLLTDTTFQYVDCVYQFLNTTNVMIYS